MNPMFEAELLAHLDVQLASARRLLELVLAQGRAIRARDVEGVLARLADVQTEMGRRAQLEQDRTALLRSAGAALGAVPGEVTLEQLCLLITPGAAQAARERSAELRGMLAEIAREHGINRALMRQELAFLSHLTRLVGQEPEGGYRTSGDGRVQTGANARPPASGATPPLYSALDLQA
jgi:hypothetical protein